MPVVISSSENNSPPLLHQNASTEIMNIHFGFEIQYSNNSCLHQFSIPSGQANFSDKFLISSYLYKL